MNYVFPNDLRELQTGKFLCIDADGDLAMIDEAVFTTGLKPVVGEVIFLPYDFSDQSYLLLDGSLFDEKQYPELTIVLEGIYNNGNEPAGFQRLPNLQDGQLFLRQCGGNLPLGKISIDTFKRHKHKYLRSEGEEYIFKISTTNTENYRGGTTLTLYESGENSSGQFNETAMKNVILNPYIRSRP